MLILIIGVTSSEVVDKDDIASLPFEWELYKKR
jgi:hypothetical protein